MNRRAFVTIAIAGVLDLGAAILFAAVEHVSIGLALYWSVTTATTVGYGDITPHTGAGHVVAIVVMLTVIPLFAATFSLLTSGLTAVHVSRENKGLHAKLNHIIANHPDIPDYPKEDK